MYWDNPRIELTYPSEQDPIVKSLHGGAHCLFYNPVVPKTSIRYTQTLGDICNWANQRIKLQGINQFIADNQNYYEIANLVKLNMWIDDIKQQGIVKPMNLYYDGADKFGINNGESRLRALERVNNIDSVFGFIGCRSEYADKFDNLESVTSFDQFARLCQAETGQKFLFTLTDPSAPYGIFWYEYDSKKTLAVTPGEELCVKLVANYLDLHPNAVFSPEWFDIAVDWEKYKSKINF